MDGNRFDVLSRTFAERSSRRQTLRRLGGGGVAGGVLGVLGLRGAAAQDDDEETKTCKLQLVAKVAVGPHKNEVFDGELTLEIGPDGAIDDGTLETPDGEVYELVGQAAGRAINLRITVGEGEFLALTGTGQQDVLLCRGSIDGTFGGPVFGDLGNWYAARRRRDATPTPTSGDDDDDDAADDDSTNGDGSQEPTPTPEPCPPTDCGSTFVLDPVSCECVCYGNGERCGESCCPGGSICDEASGSCSCPAGTELCIDQCLALCSPELARDYNTCDCVACGAGEIACGGACVSVACPEGQLFNADNCLCEDACSPGQAYCNGACIDVVNDETNCGSCGNVCGAGVPCIAGICRCPDGYVQCPDGCKEGDAC